MFRSAVILAGGFGTRLRNVVSDVPKPMAPVNQKPFLFYLLDMLVANHFSQCVISVGYMADVIKTQCGEMYRGLPIQYAQEHTPLGTGGAICYASKFLPAQEQFFVLNGDTFLKVDFNQMEQCFVENQSEVVIAAKQLDNCFRYGTLQIQNEKIIGFNAKGNACRGEINGGIYLLKNGVLNEYGDKPFSFEKDFLEAKIDSINIYASKTAGYFIDIGVPEDYLRAQEELDQYV